MKQKGLGLWKTLFDSFGVDERSVNLWRFLLGVSVILHAVVRFPDLENFYTDLGIIPRSFAMAYPLRPWSFSFFFLNGSPVWALFLFSLQIFSGIWLCTNRWPRLASLVAFLLISSADNRFIWINSGGNNIQRILLFFSIFLPRARVTVWSFAYFIQLAMIYFFCFLERESLPWRGNFTALSYNSMFEFYSGYLLRSTQGSLFVNKILTFLTMAIEASVPVLLIFSGVLGKNWWKLRSFLVAIMFLFHLALGLAIPLGLFQFYCLILWTLVIPGPVWDSSFGKRVNLLLPKLSMDFPNRLSRSYFIAGFGIVFLVALVSHNIYAYRTRGKDFGPFANIVFYLQLRQHWALFKTEYHENLWFEFVGIDRARNRKDLLPKNPGMSNKDAFFESVKNARWRQFYVAMTHDRHLWKPFIHYLCREYKEQGIVRVEFIQRAQPIQDDFSYGPMIKKSQVSLGCRQES